jgi:nitrate reductase delta subunit
MFLGRTAPEPAELVQLENIRGWTRRRFKLAPDAAVLVAEVACAMPGCPPLETAVAYWTADEQRHQFRLFKPLGEIVYDDIGWLMASEHDGVVWDCC